MKTHDEINDMAVKRSGVVPAEEMSSYVLGYVDGYQDAEPIAITREEIEKVCNDYDLKCTDRGGETNYDNTNEAIDVLFMLMNKIAPVEVVEDDKPNTLIPPATEENHIYQTCKNPDKLALLYFDRYICATCFDEFQQWLKDGKPINKSGND
jgi:hypothetical protein